MKFKALFGKSSNCRLLPILNAADDKFEISILMFWENKD